MENQPCAHCQKVRPLVWRGYCGKENLCLECAMAMRGHNTLFKTFYLDADVPNAVGAEFESSDLFKFNGHDNKPICCCEIGTGPTGAPGTLYAVYCEGHQSYLFLPYSVGSCHPGYTDKYDYPHLNK